MRLPDFLIIGAAKAGTTTLHKYLCRHPQFYQPTQENTNYIPQKPYSYKEPNFFGCEENYAKGIEYYGSLFAEAKPGQVCGEASTDYTKYPQFPESAARIGRHLPNVKLIYIMRHPVDRAYSYYVHLQRGSKVKETFEEHIQKTSVSLDGSDYMFQIEQYLRFFPKNSFLFLLMDELIQQPESTLSNVCSFIGIEDSINLIAEAGIASNQARQFFKDTNRSKITAPLRSIPVLKQTAALLPQAWRDQVYYLLKETPYGQYIEGQYIPPPMRPETRKFLLEKFHKTNQKLANFIERDLSHWSE